MALVLAVGELEPVLVQGEVLEVRWPDYRLGARHLSLVKVKRTVLECKVTLCLKWVKVWTFKNIGI